MNDRITRNPDLMCEFAKTLEEYNENLKIECLKVYNYLDICESGKLLNDKTGRLAMDTIRNLINGIVEGTRNNETISYSLKEAAKPLYEALELGGKIRGR